MVVVISFAQCSVSVNSSNGYTVDISLDQESIVAPSSCPNGYNYNTVQNYSVGFSGSNQPANLWTLQGNLYCGSQANFFDLPNSGGTGSVTSVSNPWNPNTDCATASISSLACDSVGIIIQGPGIAFQNVACPSTPLPILPIDLISFRAKSLGEDVLCSWKTASESDNDFFSIERSDNGYDWEIIGQRNGAGNSNSLLTYEFTDYDAPNGTVYSKDRVNTPRLASCEKK